MSDTIDNAEPVQELMPAACSDNVSRMSPGTLDDYYIDAYIDDPRSKINALRTAQKKAGVDHYNVTRQKAYQIHKRLSYRIESLVNERMLEGGLIGFNTLLKLALNSDQDNVRAMCASKLVEYAGKNKPAEIKTIKNRDNIRDEIELTKARILSITGKQKI